MPRDPSTNYGFKKERSHPNIGSGTRKAPIKEPLGGIRRRRKRTGVYNRYETRFAQRGKTSAASDRASGPRADELKSNFPPRG